MAPVTQDEKITIKENEKLKQQVASPEELGSILSPRPRPPPLPTCILMRRPSYTPAAAYTSPMQVAFLNEEVDKYIKFLQVRRITF